MRRSTEPPNSATSQEFFPKLLTWCLETPLTADHLRSFLRLALIECVLLTFLIPFFLWTFSVSLSLFRFYKSQPKQLDARTELKLEALPPTALLTSATPVQPCLETPKNNGRSSSTPISNGFF